MLWQRWQQNQQTQQPPVRIVPTLEYVLLVAIAEGTNLRAVPASLMILECTFGSGLQTKSIPTFEFVMVLPWIRGTDIKNSIPVALPNILLEVTEMPSAPAIIPASGAFTTVLADIEPAEPAVAKIPIEPALTIRLLVTVTAPPPIKIPVVNGTEVVTSLPFITAVSSGAAKLVSASRPSKS